MLSQYKYDRQNLNVCIVMNDSDLDPGQAGGASSVWCRLALILDDMILRMHTNLSVITSELHKIKFKKQLDI